MLKVLAELEKLAETLDSKKQYKLADEVEKIMEGIVTVAQERLSRDQIPDTIPELQAHGDPYTYGYLAHNDTFVVTSPRGLGVVIEQGGRYNDSWEKLQARLPDSLRLQQPSASGGLSDRSEEVHMYQEKALEKAKQIRDKLNSGGYGPELQSLMMRNSRLNRYYRDTGTISAPEFIQTLESVLSDPGVKEMVHSLSPIWADINMVKSNLELAQQTSAGTSPAEGLRPEASENSEKLQKEASLDFISQMEAAFHSPSRKPFGR